MESSSGEIPSTVMERLLIKLGQIESELKQIIRVYGGAQKFAAHEAHSFVRQAIKALSKDIAQYPAK